jgi:hypothetical protein
MPPQDPQRRDPSQHAVLTPSLLMTLLEIRRRQRLNHTGTLTEPGSKNPIRIHEHAVFQGHNNELTALESSLDQSTDILRM